ncbi:MAG: hypothetical protein UZ13_02675 [Chloroflexi bacterium OLB13]|nr:MAG: hypothetical protein UZ13_02675 [Chloroflexi bacterium OLB13]
MRAVRRIGRIAFALVMLTLFAGCNGKPTREVFVGELLAADDFDSAGRWDQMTLPDIVLDVRGGMMHIEADSRIYAATLDYQTQTDVVIDVDARLLSEDDSNGFGIMCRAASASTGYYFLIGGDGSGTIRRGGSRGVEALAAWTRADSVMPGAARNRIRAVCDGDYLALYVNGEFVAEARDTLYSRGYSGLVAVTTRPDQRVEVDFDLLRIYAAQSPHTPISTPTRG